MDLSLARLPGFIFHYRNPRLCLEFVSVPRAKQKTLGKEVFAESEIKNSRHRKNTRHRGFFAESQTKNSRQRKKHLAKISLPRANFLALGKEI
jgi:protein required for attachment to host cells